MFDYVTPWTVACQVFLSMGLSRQGYWSGLPFPPGDLSDPGIEPASLALTTEFFTTEPPARQINRIDALLTFLIRKFKKNSHKNKR